MCARSRSPRLRGKGPFGAGRVRVHPKGENTSVAASRLQVAPSAAVCCVIGCGDRSQRAQTLERLLYEKKLAPRRALYDEGARPARTASLA